MQEARFEFELSAELYDVAAAQAAQEGITVEEYIRRLLLADQATREKLGLPPIGEELSGQ